MTQQIGQVNRDFWETSVGRSPSIKAIALFCKHPHLGDRPLPHLITLSLLHLGQPTPDFQRI
ncbi:hypothetical protein [Leptolyngbya sp. O-77]|uniref:hypothetical protein n=1 Tax=Leptolyngbya sp. O-77 TaxID=1080068 RepID=UPI000B2CBA90|nr:hypothetical protein [Leptolyngbya sp. O-77]